MLKVIATGGDAGLGTLGNVVDSLPDLGWTHPPGKTVDGGPQLLHGGWWVLPELDQTDAPEPEIQWREVRRTGGPGSVSLVADHPIAKLGLEPVSNQLCGMWRCSVLLEDVPPSTSHIPDLWPHHSLQHLQATVVVDSLLLAKPMHIWDFPPWTQFSSITNGSDMAQYLSF